MHYVSVLKLCVSPVSIFTASSPAFCPSLAKDVVLFSGVASIVLTRVRAARCIQLGILDILYIRA